MHRSIVDPNGIDHRGHSYTAWVIRTGKIITDSIMHIHATPISVKQYLCEQIRKTTGQLEDVQAVPTEGGELSEQQVQDHRTGVHKAESKHLKKRGKKCNTLPCNQIQEPMKGVQRLIPDLPGKSLWLALDMTRDQTYVPHYYDR